MVSVVSKEIIIEESLKKKIEFICDFCNIKPIIINGSIRNIKHTNLNYIEPHRIIIKNKIILAFNYNNSLYINNLNEEINIKDLEKYIKSL